MMQEHGQIKPSLRIETEPAITNSPYCGGHKYCDDKDKTYERSGTEYIYILKKLKLHI